MRQTTIRVAIADDHPLFRSGISGLMEKLKDPVFKYQKALEAGNGAELLEGLAKISRSAIPHIVLLDLSMPKKNGFETIAPLRAQYPEMKILVMTMRSDDQSIIRSLKLGACGYISKDAEPGELKEAIDICWTKGFYLPELISHRLIRQLIDPSSSHIDPSVLTGREIEFVQLACSELTYSQIAEKMSLSVRTIDGYRENLFARFNVSSRVGLVLWAIRNELIENLPPTTN